MNRNWRKLGTYSIHHFINYNINIGLPYFRLSPLCTWNLHSSRSLRIVSRLPMFQACVSALRTKLNMFKTISWHCDTISRNISDKPTYTAQCPRTAKILVILIQIIIFCEFYFCDIYKILLCMFLSPPPHIHAIVIIGVQHFIVIYCYLILCAQILALIWEKRGPGGGPSICWRDSCYF
jgi:hypothetical protein